MNYSKKNLPKSQIALEVRVPAQELAKQKPKALETLAKNLRVQGFRQGHVPLEIAAKYVQESEILAEAARLAIANAYKDIVLKENLDVIGEPEVKVLKLAWGNPMEFQVQVALLPDIPLPDYKAIASKVTRRKPSVEEQEVDSALQWLRESRKTKDGVVPEATNEFAQGLGNFADLASLRQSIKEGLEHEKEVQERDRIRQEIVENIAEQSSFEIPEILVEREKQALLSSVKQAVESVMRTPFAEYIKKINKTEQELFDSFAPEAEQRVKRFLVVREVAEKERIEPTPQEIEQEANNFLKHYSTIQKVQKEFDLPRLKEYTKGVLRHEKTLQFLEQFVQA